MRNYLYLFLVLLLGGGSSFAQTAVTTAGGETFHLGDSLTIGLPHTPGERYRTIHPSSWEYREIPAFTKGKLKWHIPTPKRNIFGKLIPQDTVYFLNHPKFPKDSLVVYLGEAVQKGEIVTAPVEHTPLYPEAVELLPQDYVPALIKAGYTTYTDVAIKAYAQSLGNGESSNSATNNPFEYQRQQASLLEKLKKAVEKFDLNQVYYARHQLTTDGYDFTRSGYPCLPSPSSLLQVTIGYRSTSPHSREYPSSAYLLSEPKAMRSALVLWGIRSIHSMHGFTSDCSLSRAIQKTVAVSSERISTTSGSTSMNIRTAPTIT